MSAKSTTSNFFGDETLSVNPPNGPIRMTSHNFFGGVSFLDKEISAIAAPDNFVIMTGLDATTYVKVGNGLSLQIVIAGNDGTVTYQWYKNDVAISGEAGSSITVQSATENMNNDVYKVVATDEEGHSVSSSTTLYVYAALAIATDLAAENKILQGSTLSLEATASGGVPPYSYDWAASGASANVFTETLTIENISADYNGKQYQSNITDSVGNRVQSTTTLVTVVTPLAIQTDLESAETAAAGAMATFGPIAISGGLTPYTYQWYREDGGVWAAITDATNPSYQTPTLESSDDGAIYRVTATDAFGQTITSSASTLTVTTS